MTIGQRRRALGIGITKAARLAGITVYRLDRAERGLAPLSATETEALEAMFSRRRRELLGDETL